MQTRIADFAARHVATRPDLHSHCDIPMDIWTLMREEGLFRIGITGRYGGAGGGYPELVGAGEAFVRYGLNLGLAFSWLYQQILARYIIDLFGSPELKAHLLPELAAGKITLSFAVSEPGRGAHPKHLQTKAVRQNHAYILNGEKTYLTNGPMADLFIVVAVTDETAQHRRFTAFAVERQAPGVTVGPPLTLNFLKPSLHGGIALADCMVGPDAVLGTQGNAWAEMVVPMGEIEDVVMMGPAVGAMSAQLNMVIESVKKTGTASDRSLQGDIGHLHAFLQTLRIIAGEAATRLENVGSSSTPLGIVFARLASDFQNALTQCIEHWRIEVDDAHAFLRQDLETLGALRRTLLRRRREKIGAALLKPG